MKDALLDQLTAATWSGLLNSRFRVQADPANWVDLTLVQVTPRPEARSSSSAPSGFQNESFSLLFNGPDNRLLQQKIYVFEHDQIGRFDLFIVPIGRSKNAFEYQAVFNRLVKSK